ncbi:hypothetical protein L210DRAFT_3532026 [Boletus edulis BED1]|uniref:Uncharacterized protein n=1 Tax=Boletus edulis BED1 TaxID=1328754 RepID=A0AAD4GGW1_BOLED|nr:hypothetical protein L210DRAFT_3532026 [Boletus edulis BED1]
MRYSASAVLVPAYQESGIPTHPVGDPPAYKYLAHRAGLFPLETFTARSPPAACLLASVEDVARLSLSPAGRVVEHRTPSLTNAGVPSATSLPHIDLVAEGPFISSPHPSSQAPSSTPSPEFSDEESPRESSNFSFHLYQDEEWTDEVEARMQNMIDQMLEDARRLLAEPTINFSERFPDDFLEDSANPRTSCFAASSLEDDDQEDGAEEEEGLGMDIVWEESAAFVPARPLTPIPEESPADEFVVEEDAAHSPPLSFKYAICFEERQWVADKVQITTRSSAEPPIPPTPPDVYLRQRRRRWKPPDPYRRWVAAWKKRKSQKN